LGRAVYYSVLEHAPAADRFLSVSGQEDSMRHFGAIALPLVVTCAFAFAQEPVALTPEQERSIYRSVASERAQPPLPDFQPEVGATLPDTVMLSDLPSGLAIDFPRAKDFKFAKLHDQVLLVDPFNKRVVEIINSPGASQTTGRGSGNR
jgi:hypothetical protein